MRHEGESEGTIRSILSAIMHSQADKTQVSYCYAFLRWHAWAKLRRVSALPADPHWVVKYFAHLSENSRTPSPVQVAFSALSWVHKICHLADPADNYLCRALLASAKRSRSSAIGRKEHLTKQDLGSIVDAHSAHSLDNLLLKALCCLAFNSLMRSAEVLSLQTGDVKIVNTGLILCLRKSKTDQFRRGHEIPLAKSTSKICPVTHLLAYCRAAKLTLLRTSHAPLFQTVRRNTLTGKPLLYADFLRIFRQALARVGFDPISIKKYGTHSFRSGGASRAVQVGMSIPTLRHRGRWTTDTSMTRYIARGEGSKLQASLAIQ